ncbi:MarR family winged helix-turn-helix transcriptional regulator [Aquicoccus sp. G2-2]|uniref:MarR family winged helix-turn-helix transcriptional regulator n=1 Tax=Aquicoccus sp. G2-2 TaxID=3092120 RepID=UPI002ADFCAD0|nr:MarR family transcriptional regulator [Aquicoccus sp. G2-2]MEA1114048.1 MarR family transcriptional regulator [Aquicoccus sp. G2-2]
MPDTPKPIALLIHEADVLLKREFERNARPFKLTLMQWRVLGVLRRNGAMKQVELGAATNTSAMTVSDVAERLKCMGLVDRYADPDDSRARLVALTETGEAQARTMRKVADGVFERMLTGVAPEDVDALTRALLTITKNLEG